MAEKKVKLAIIDAHALIHRGYHALPPMSTRDGRPVNAAYGFTSMLLKMFSVLKPTHVVATFDMRGPTFRHKKYAEYKAGRKKAPEDLVSQFEIVRDIVRAFNIPLLEKQGYEADDIIGTLVEQIDGDVNKIIVTGDMDTLQLIDDDTSVFTLRRGMTDTFLYDEQAVREKYGFGPEHVVDYKGLRGDPSDNIPGVAGIGEKTAKDLVGAYGSIEEVFKHLDEASTRAQSRLVGHKKDALFSRDLATIVRDVPIDFSLQDAVLEDYDASALRGVLQELGFTSLIERLPGGAKKVQPSLFDTKKKEDDSFDMPKNYYVADDKKSQVKLRTLISKSTIVAFDTETDGLGARDFPIIGMSFAVRKGKKVEAWYVPVTPKTLVGWRDILENPKIRKTGHNLKYDYKVLLQSGIELSGIVFDSMIASYLLNPGTRQHGMDELASLELDYHPIPITDLIGEGKEQKKMSEISLSELARYACEDADVSLKLYEVFVKKIEEEGLTKVLEEIEIPLVSVLAKVELNGVAVDVDGLHNLNKKVVSRIAKLQKDIWKEAGGEFNINSTKQLRVILFETLNLPVVGIKRTQTGYSTAASELEKLYDKHSIIALLEQYRELNKLQNTYISTLPNLVDTETGRIYTSFNQVVTATGRLSSSEPNLQNIPIRSDLGHEVRKAFVAEKGNMLVKADYSQLELRIVAHMSQDKKMIDAFLAGVDIHSATASFVFGIDIKDVTSEQRRQAKTLNFGVLYGMGPSRFAREAGVSSEEARSFVERYREEYVGVAKMIADTVSQAASVGYVETLFGRKRAIPEIHSSNPAIQAQAERVAFNFPIQGTGADVIKKAMIAMQSILERDFPEAKMVLTVHDELVCEVSEKRSKALADVMKSVMESVVTLDVALDVDVGIGKNWGEV